MAKTKYNDSEADAIRAARITYGGFDSDHSIGAIPDSSVPFCWLVVDFTDRVALIVHLNEPMGDDMVYCDECDTDEDKEWERTCRIYLKAGGEIPNGLDFPGEALC